MSELGKELLESMAEALAHAKGERTGYRTHRIKVTPNEVRMTRERIGLSQDKFAAAIGVSASTLRKWEQGQRQPTGAAKTLLKVMEREPKAVIRALQGA